LIAHRRSKQTFALGYLFGDQSQAAVIGGSD
jgi:hypothetical protein